MLSSERLNDLLDEAFKHYNQNNYLECIEVCRGLLNYSDIKAKLQSVMGLCFLHLDEIDRAEVHLQKAYDLNPYLSYALLGSAYIDLFRNRPQTALFKYTRLNNLKKEKKRVMRILSLIKTMPDTLSLVSEKKMHLFIPQKLPLTTNKFKFVFSRLFALFLLFTNNRNFTKKNWFLVFLGFLVIAGVVGWLLLFFSSSEPPDSTPLTPTHQQLANDPLANIYLFETNHENLAISAKEIADCFENMKKYIRSKRINEAIVIYNRMDDANINLFLKEKFKLLYGLVPTPNFATFENTYAIEDQIRKREFRNTYIKITGIASKVKRTKNKKVVFNFTLTDKEDFLYTVEVFFEDSLGINIEKNVPYELLAKQRGFDKRSKKIILQGLIIKKQL